ncbi:MAG: FG-GAP-like repeat-containing protein [Pirellulaceae bacterium]
MTATAFVEASLTPQALGYILSTEIADIDGDGDGDLIVSNTPGSYGMGDLRWHRNDDGVFAESQVLIDVDEVWSIEFADLDGDGDLDILLATQHTFDNGNDETDDSIAWYANDGQGNFSNRIVIDQLENSGGLVAGDIDGDGDVDFIASQRHSDEIRYYENLGNGLTFQLHSIASDDSTFLLNNTPRPWEQSHVLADMDGDADLDIVTTTIYGVVWLENLDGAGNFFTLPHDVSPIPAFEAIAIHVADIDQDDDLDVVVGSDISVGRASWFENLGGGQFADEVIIGLADDQVETVNAADMDGDGDIDLIYADWWANMTWAENVDNTFTQLHRLPNYSPPEGFPLFPLPRHIIVSDFDHDGDADVIYSSYHERKLAIFENRLVGDVNDDGVFDSADLVQIFQAGVYEDDIAMNASFDQGDWNNDGEFDSADLVVAFQAGNYSANAKSNALVAQFDPFTLGTFEQDKRAKRPAHLP